MVELAAMGGRALLVPVSPAAWVSRAVAGLVAVVALAAPGSMRAVSLTAQQVGVPGLVVPVEQAELRARLAPTPRRSSAVQAVSAATPEWLVVARRV